MSTASTTAAQTLDVALAESRRVREHLDVQQPVAGSGKCTVGGCECPSYVDPPGGFNCARCGHVKSDHW